MGEVLVRRFVTCVIFAALFLTGDLAAAAPGLQASSVEGSSSGIFINPEPASAVVSGVGTSFFTWGTGVFGSPPSSLRFTGNTFTADLDEVFSFGTLTIFNGRITSGADAVDLQVTILLTMPSGLAVELTQTLRLVNTPNVGTPEENADRVILPTAIPDPLTFTVDGVEHALEFIGFGSITGAGSATTIDAFSVLEEETASAELLGRISTCGEPGFHLGAVPVQGGSRILCWKENISKGFLGFGEKLTFALTLVNPNPGS